MYNDDDELREEEEKSLLKEMAKKGISKKIKTIPLGTKITIICILSGIIFLLIFTVLVSALAMMYFYNGDDSDSDYESGFAYLSSNSEDNFWWPIGGSNVETIGDTEYAIGDPVSTRITSYFSMSRTIDGVTKPHYGIDIGSSGGTDYIIAINNGTVYQVGTGCNNQGYYGSNCNGGFGNYIVIEHPGSIYSIYAHLYPDSITVEKNDTVRQGQIIGQMGNSGSSTGKHLHFQIEVGGRSSIYAVDPLNYVSVEESRPKTVNSGYTGESQLLTMLQSWEGTGPTDGDSYVVYDDSTGTLTVGHGVTLKNNVERFSKRGIDTSTLSEGSKVPKTLVDDIELEIVNERRNDVIDLINENNISLEEHQIDALTIRIYNVGNVNNFPENYKTYGNTNELYENYMNKPVTGGGEYTSGLARRRQAEWDLFSKGIYTLNT